MRIVIGAGKTYYDGWISTQENELDLLNRADFERMFAYELPTAFLAEHVWEHMTLQEGVTAAKNCYDYLADGGYIRIAVPDKNFRNEWYQNMVKVGGNGDPAHPAGHVPLLRGLQLHSGLADDRPFPEGLLRFPPPDQRKDQPPAPCLF